eukprot:1708124-Karenia_brevis.AAC.1
MQPSQRARRVDNAMSDQRVNSQQLFWHVLFHAAISVAISACEKVEQWQPGSTLLDDLRRAAFCPIASALTQPASACEKVWSWQRVVM